MQVPTALEELPHFILTSTQVIACRRKKSTSLIHKISLPYKQRTLLHLTAIEKSSFIDAETVDSIQCYPHWIALYLVPRAEVEGNIRLLLSSWEEGRHLESGNRKEPGLFRLPSPWGVCSHLSLRSFLHRISLRSNDHFFPLGPCGTKYSLWTSSSVSLQSLLKIQNLRQCHRTAESDFTFLTSSPVTSLINFEKSWHWLKVQLR